MWSDCVLDLGIDFLVSNGDFFVINGSEDVKYLVNSFLPLVYVDDCFASLHLQEVSLDCPMWLT